jgi:hypothetical protein
MRRFAASGAARGRPNLLDMTLRCFVQTISVVALLAPLALVACSDDDDEEHDDDHSHEPASPSCVDLSDACHEVDTGTGRPAECHEIAHEDVEADCAANLADCTAACAAVM